MTARLTGLLALLVSLAALLAAPAAAATPANVRDVIRDYRDDGKLDPCAHSIDDLRDTLEAITADTEQYAPDFPAAVEGAIEARARGECDKEEEDAGAGGAATPAPTPTPPPAGTPTPAPTPAPGATPGEVVAEPPAPPVAATPAPAPPATPARTVAARDGFARVPLAILAALLALSLLTGLVLLAIHRFGWGEERLAGARHALAEAGYRTGGTWQDFTDWLRLGR